MAPLSARALARPRASASQLPLQAPAASPRRCARVGYSSERLWAVDFGASCGSALAVVPASVLGELRLPKVLLRAVSCVVGYGGAFARRRSSTLLLPEQLASSAPKMDTTRMRSMTLSRGSRSITVRVFLRSTSTVAVRLPSWLRHVRRTSRLSCELRLYHVA